MAGRYHQHMGLEQHARSIRTIPELKRQSLQQELAAVTLLEALEHDDRPTFAIEVESAPTYHAPLDLLYTNTALTAIEGLLANVTGHQEATSVFNESSWLQLAFWRWLCGQAMESDVHRRGNAYTFEGHIWNALTIGRYIIVSGVPTLLLWVGAAPGGRGRVQRASTNPSEGKSRQDTTLSAQLSSDILSHGKARQPTALPSHFTLSAQFGSDVPPPAVAAKHGPFDYTLHPLPPAVASNAHIDYFRSVDWTDTPLGPMEAWPSDLRSIANMVLNNIFPAVLFWGDDVVMLYNEAYSKLLGPLHPCMGKSVRTEAVEHWLAFQPLVDHINATGESVTEKDMLLFIDRHGFLEETHWSFQFIPILDSNGHVTAYFQSFYEVTDHHLLERRVSSLAAIGSQNASARDLQSYWDITLRSLSLNDKDIPLALLYATERHASAEIHSVSSPGCNPSLEKCILKGTIGVAAHHPIAPATINMNEESYLFHSFLRQAARSGKATVVHLDDLTFPGATLEGINWRGYGDPCRIFIICPFLPTTGEHVEGFLILGISPRRPFDDNYQLFVQVMVRLLATSLASIVLFDEEVRQRENAIGQAAQIQEQLLAELKSKEKKFQLFAERADVGIFIIDRVGQYTYRNQRWFDLFDIASADDDTKTCWEKIAFPDDLPFCEAIFGKLTVEHEAVCFELRTQMPWDPPSELVQSDCEDARHYKWILCSAYPELGPNGDLVEIVGNVTDISKQKWAEGIQKMRTDSALQGKQHLEHFIDTTSHEMRNPLSAILQCADGILSSYSHDDDQPPTPGGWHNFLESTLDAAQTIAQCAQHMRHIVDDILTISKLDSGLLVITPVAAQPESVARHAVKMFEAEARAAGVEITLQIDPSYRALKVDWVSLDPTRVLQILINLITNAIKFTRLETTPRCVTVTVAASVEEPVSVSAGIQFNEDRLVGCDPHLEDDWKQAQGLFFLQFFVTDTGRGLSEDERGSLFTRFSQASPRTHIHYGGSGLGLFISRRLTELQGGAIGLASEFMKGCTFSFYIKTRRATPTTSRKGSLPHVFPEDIRHRAETPLISLSRPLPKLRVQTADGTWRSNSPSPTLKRKPAHSKKAPIAHSHVLPETLGLPEGPDLQELKRTKSIPETLHVLVVEDNLVNQRVLAKQLRNLGCVVSVANHGREALEFLPKTTCWNYDHPDSNLLASRPVYHIPSTEPIFVDEDVPPIELSLILMDWEMPIMNGLMAVAKIRELEKDGLLKGRVPVIGVTANVRQQQIDQAMKAGMDDVVGKPFRVAELLIRMRGIVAGMTHDMKL